MKISALTSTQVWAASSRSLTNIGSGALAFFNTLATSIAANTAVDLRTTAGSAAQLTISAQTGATATANIQISHFDGAAAFAVATSAAAANASTGFTMSGTSTIGPRVFNSDAAIAARYIVGGYLWTQ